MTPKEIMTIEELQELGKDENHAFCIYSPTKEHDWIIQDNFSSFQKEHVSLVKAIELFFHL